jgi:hypothetical protein
MPRPGFAIAAMPSQSNCCENRSSVPLSMQTVDAGALLTARAIRSGLPAPFSVSACLAGMERKGGVRTTSYGWTTALMKPGGFCWRSV